MEKTELKKLTKFAQPEDWQQKVDKVKADLRKKGINDKQKLARILKAARADKDAAEEDIKEANTTIEAVNQMMVSLLDEEGINSFRTQDGWQFIQKSELYVAVEDKGNFYAWVKETGQEDLFTINYMTAASVVKDQLEQGQSLPPGVKIFLKESITVRKPATTQGD